jgi:beta-galactosidase
MFGRNVTVDFVHPRADLSRYRLVVASHLYLVSDETVTNLMRWVADGGTLLTTFFSGIVDPWDRVRPGPYPGAFRDLLGLRIEEFVPLVDGQANAIETGDGQVFEATLWSDVIEVGRAEVVARFRDEFFAGRPAVTVNRLERGSAYHAGTNLDASGLRWLLDLVCRVAGVSTAGGLASDMDADATGALEVVERRDASSRWLFVLNHGTTAAELPLDAPAVDAIRGTRFEETARVEPMDLVILWSAG